MSAETPAPSSGTSFARAVRHNLLLVVACLVLGTVAGWAYLTSTPTQHTSTTRILVNPAVGNPYAPTPASVRQDELTSLETEAQMVRSAEVLDTVVAAGQGSSTAQLAAQLEVTVPPNTQILEISYSAVSADRAREVAGAVAEAYLDNRAARFGSVKDARISRVQTQTLRTVEDLRKATADAQRGTGAQRAFNAELADALRNELVSLRAQRSALENTESPVGAVVSPASTPKEASVLSTAILPVGGALAGLALGCLLALLVERTRNLVRRASDADAAGLPILAATPAARWRDRLFHRSRGAESIGTTIRRLRTTVLGMEPRPHVITVTPAGDRRSAADASEVLAQSFVRGGHPVVLVRPDRDRDSGSLEAERRGLSDALIHERLNVLDLLQPSAEPILSILNGGGLSAEARELLTPERLRATLRPLVDAGHVVVIQASGTDGTEDDAFVGAADLALVVVTVGRSRRRSLERLVSGARSRGGRLGALVVRHGELAHVPRHADEESASPSPARTSVTRDDRSRTRT